MYKSEEKIRELDNEDERIYLAARRIHKELKVKFNTISAILTAKRKGFQTFRKYMDFIAQQQGFLNESEYKLYYYYKRKGNFTNLRDFQEREGFNPDVSYLSQRVLDSLPSRKDYSRPSFALEKEEENRQISLILERIIEKLPEEYKLIIQKRFYEGKTLKQTAQEMSKKSKQIIKQKEDRAIKKLYPLARSNGLYDFYIKRN